MMKGLDMKKWMIGLAGPLALVAQPVAAQDHDEMQIGMGLFGAMSEMFEVEPLTPEQEARMPLARTLAAQVVPEGAMTEMMSGMFDGLLGPMMNGLASDPVSILNERLDYALPDTDMDEAAARQALDLLDPAWEERNTRMIAAMQRSTATMAEVMEPVIRAAMAELYAIRFDDEQLADISAFYATETGAVFARESYMMASDPRIVGAMFADPDATFGAFGTMAEEMAAVDRGLPARRGYGDLSEEQRGELSRLTGLSKADLEATMQAEIEL